MKSFIIILAITASGVCFAQEKPAAPEVRALTQRVGTEINANIQCSAQSFTLQDKLAAAEAEVKRLTEKYEPKKDDPAK